MLKMDLCAPALNRQKFRTPPQPLVLAKPLVAHRKATAVGAARTSDLRRYNRHCHRLLRATSECADYFFGVPGASCARPRRRRRLMSRRPALVFIRPRKPCFRRRRLLCGWYVLFTAVAPASAPKAPPVTNLRPTCQASPPQKGADSLNQPDMGNKTRCMRMKPNVPVPSETVPVPSVAVPGCLGRLLDPPLLLGLTDFDPARDSASRNSIVRSDPVTSPDRERSRRTTHLVLLPSSGSTFCVWISIRVFR